MLHSAFSTPPKRQAVNLKSAVSTGNAGLIAKQKAMEAMQKKKEEMAQMLKTERSIDSYFKQFNGTTCVEHPGVYEHKYKTSAGFSGAAKLFTRQVRLSSFIHLVLH